MTGCEMCDLNNQPSLGTMNDKVIDLHRALHEVERELTLALKPVVSRLNAILVKQ